MHNKVDLHSHVLDGIDDGAKDLAQSLRLCELYVKNGFTKVCATPHFIKGGKYEPEASLIQEKVAVLNKALKAKEIPLEIASGMEIKLTGDTIYGFKQEELLSLNGSSYVLVELPTTDVKNFVNNILFEIQSEGFIPIVAHPERYMNNMIDLSYFKELVDRGILLQVNKGSIVGEFGKSAYVNAQKLLKAGLVHFISTDTHKERFRNPNMKEVQKKLIKLVGQNNTELLLCDNPQAVWEDEPVMPMKKFTRHKLGFYLKTAAASLLILASLAAGGVYAFNRQVDKLLESFFTEELLNQLEEAIKGAELDDETRRMLEELEDSMNGVPEIEIPEIQIPEIQIPDVDIPEVEKSEVDRPKADRPKVDNPEGKDLASSKEPPNIPIETNENFTTVDRAKVVKIVYDTIPPNEINRMQEMVTDGITSEDINEVKTIVKKNMTSAQIDELKVLYKKYVSSK
jgi:protein-tyrosine phosphatase